MKTIEHQNSKSPKRKSESMQYTTSQDVKDLMNKENSTDLNQMSRKHANAIILSGFIHYHDTIIIITVDNHANIGHSTKSQMQGSRNIKYFSKLKQPATVMELIELEADIPEMEQ
jgi:hypothetical protein